MDRKGEPEGRSCTFNALHSHCSLLPLNQVLTEVEAQAQSHLPAALDSCLGDLIEPLPDIGLLLKRETRPPILDPDPTPCRFSDDANLYGFGRRSKFEGIGQVVAENLLDPISICVDRDRVLFGQVPDEAAVGMSCPVILD